jgi:hypothetical protein
MYRQKLGQVKQGDAEDHYQLGMWLKKVNYHEFAKEEFEKAIIFNPDHEGARAELGYVKRAVGWILPKEETQEPWVHGLKKAVRSPAPVRRKVFDRKLLDGLPRELIEAADNLVAEDPNARACAFSAFATVCDPETSKLVNEVMEAHYGGLLVLFDSHQKGILDLLKGQTLPSLHDMQVKWLERWEAARIAALNVIYDRKIYPDENHGVVGQPVVDEKVDAVRNLWPYYDALVRAELARIAQLSPQTAARMLDRYEFALARVKEVREWLKGRGVEVEEPVERVTDVYRALLSHEAGRYGAAWKYACGLEDWEFRLYFRLVAHRILHYNDKVVKTSAAEEERLLVTITNEYRMIMGRQVLEIDERLVQSSRKHSEEMNRLGYFGHVSPTPGRETPDKRAAAEGYNGGVGENCHYGRASAHGSFNGWYNSAPHHRNMLGGGDPRRINLKGAGDRSQTGPNFVFGGWRSMGCGRDGDKFTEQFGPLSSLDEPQAKK